MPKKNRNNYHYRNGNNYQSNGGGSGSGGGGGGGSGQNYGRYSHSNGGGVRKWSSNNNSRQQNSNRRIYLNPTVIDALDRDDNMGANVPHTSTATSGSAGNFHEDRKNKKNRRQVFDRLKDVAKPKLTIGDSEAEVKKQLIESRPHCKLSTMPDDVFNMIVAYVQNYFNCFDANRETLLAAYNPKVTFSFSINTSASASHRTFKFDDFLYKQSRNLKRINGNDDHHIEKRYKLLHQGYIDTVSFLNKLPPTEHEPNSFKLDSCYFTPHMISFSLSGVFKEGKPSDKVRPLRSFQRIFVCIPDPNYQMTIINEQFILTNITIDQFKKYYPDLMGRNNNTNTANDANRQATNQAVSAAAAASSVVVVQPVAPQQPVVTPASVDPNLVDQQNLMIQQFSTQSHLTLEWSKYCLEFSQWNYEKAAEEFLKHKDKIPKEGFLVVT